MIHHNGFLYVSIFVQDNTSYILKMNPTTAQYIIFTSGLHSCAGCTIAGDYIYAMNIYNGTISQISLTTGAIINATWKTGLNTPLIITNDGTYIYTGDVNGTIARMVLPTATVVNISDNISFVNFTGINQNSTASGFYGLGILNQVGNAVLNGYLLITSTNSPGNLLEVNIL